MYCQDCGHFWSPGQNDPGLSDGESCPMCGGRAYRDQPSPSDPNDMTQTQPGYDMPNATQDDMGCACGCGNAVNVNRRGKRNTFITGHNLSRDKWRPDRLQRVRDNAETVVLLYATGMAAETIALLFLTDRQHIKHILVDRGIVMRTGAEQNDADCWKRLRAGIGIVERDGYQYVTVPRTHPFFRDGIEDQTPGWRSSVRYGELSRSSAAVRRESPSSQR